MDAIHLLRDLALVLGSALIAGVLCLRLRQPVLVGYLLAGVLIGPYGLRVISDQATIAQLAEIGVILLMFALGVEFSLAQFRPVRRLVLLGGGLFIGLTTAATAEGLFLAGQPVGADLLFGFMLALSSTIIVLRVLMERNEVESAHGKAMLGWLILQDIAVVPMLVAVPFLARPGGAIGVPLATALSKVAVFLIGMYVVGTRLFPPLLNRIAAMRHKEIFFLAVLGLCFGTAAISASLGLSLALGAFLGGLVISQSDAHRQVLAEVLPIRDLFVTLFFVSIGMLIDLHYVAAHAGLILGLVALVMAGKALLGTGIATAFKLSSRSSLLIGMGLAQIGEFSFVLAREGQRVGLLSAETFSLVLATALVTMLATPSFIQLSGPLSRWLARFSPPGRTAEGAPAPACALTGHVVIVGYGRVGAHLGAILHQRRVPFLVVDLDQQLLRRLQRQGIATLYGDAGMREVLAHAGLPCARLLVLALPDPGTSMLVAEHARRLAPQLPLIVRVHRQADMEAFLAMDAAAVVQPEFEASLALVRAALTHLEWPPHLIHAYVAQLRHSRPSGLHEPWSPELSEALLDAPVGAETAWIQLPESSALVGQALAEADLHGQTGAHVLVVSKPNAHVLHPGPEHVLEAGHHLLMLGTPAQLEQVLRLIHAPTVTIEQHVSSELGGA